MGFVGSTKFDSESKNMNAKSEQRRRAKRRTYGEELGGEISGG
jgi:hypothetical protein